MLKAIKLWWIKRQFREAVITFRNTCPELGLSMAGMFAPNVWLAAREANRLAEILKEIDPEFPKAWVPLKDKP